MPLSMGNIGELVSIKHVSGNDETRQHLAELGFIIGEPVTIVSKNGGNLIINVKDSRIALDKTLANRIMI
ncbi:ferrous iron transport protein A [Butyrivibrio sp. X503]|uniref:FeoA family protein n=1 Tax=unclassified Butyrivibrio TaxID=2639466 RepID=UPI000EAA40EA|nr:MULTISPECIES: FeoA family protein [unclassified Butyrivibrio]RKM57355.1 ferrous iron transport protein A [Butyrivibrio sp. X503]RKM59056.1 ferrous iron transport protein A [Butyrivibrio sp. XB500-5]